MKTITLTDDEYREIENSLPYLVDHSYCIRIAHLIAGAITREIEHEHDSTPT